MENYPERKTIRLKEYNYSGQGYYFITICTKDKKCLFGSISSDNIATSYVGADIIRPQLTSIGKMIENAIHKMPKIYSNVIIDKYVIMPNHVHIIIIMNNIQEEQPKNGRILSAPTTISTIVGQMKRYVTKQAGFAVWQKSFYDHVIRSEAEYLEIWEYMENNPVKWELDTYYCK